jgi:hypothetical protein
MLEAPFQGGMVLPRGGAAITGSNATVVIKGTGGGQWYILTGFPTP